MMLKPIINLFCIAQFICAHIMLVSFDQFCTSHSCDIGVCHGNRLLSPILLTSTPKHLLCHKAAFYEFFCTQTGRHQPNRAEIVITLTMTNYIKRRDVIGSGRNSHFCLVLVSDADNKVVFKQRLG